MAKHNDNGALGEDIAAKFLISKGYYIRETQWRFERLEIDLIIENEHVIAFVEVKTRSSAKYGNPFEAVTLKKQKHLIHAADDYVNRYEIDKDLRFDVVAVILSDPPQIEHMEEAFTPEFR